MTDFSYSQLEGLWEDAGGPRTLAPVAAAIAMAESGGRSDAENPSGATGLWQILGNPFPGNALDPQTNAKMAVAKWKDAGHSFSPWVTFTDGQYKKFLKGGNPPPPGPVPPGQGIGNDIAGTLIPAISNIPGLGILSLFGGTVSTVGDIGSAVTGFVNEADTLMTGLMWFTHPYNWLRILCGVLGIPLVGIGIVTLTIGAKPIPVSAYGVSTEVSAGSIAPAIGIAEVTLGAVLLFFAFHNTGAQNPGDMLGYIKAKAGGEPSATSGGGGNTA